MQTLRQEEVAMLKHYWKMTISYILQSFNWALDEVRGNKGNYFLASVTNVTKKIGEIKTISIKVFLVDQQEKGNKCIIDSTWTGHCPTDMVDKYVDSLSLDVVMKLALIFKDHSQELADGTYTME